MTCESIGVWPVGAGGFAILSALLWIAASVFKCPPLLLTKQLMKSFQP